MAIELEGLEFKVEGISGGSAKELEDLTNALSGLKSALPSKGKIQGVADGFRQLSAAFSSIEGQTKVLGRFAAAMTSIKNLRVSPTLGKSLESLAASAEKFSSVSDEAIAKVEKLALALKNLKGLGRVSLNLSQPEIQEQMPETTEAEDSAQDLGDAVTDSRTSVESFFNTIMSGSSRAAEAFNKIKGPIVKVGSAIASIPKFFAKDMVQGISQSVKKVGELFAGLKRIALYRAMRTAIKMFTQGLSEGLKNVYAYSQLVGTSFAHNMDLIATNSQYAKNSLGAMAAPLLNAIAPAVDFVTDKFVELFNVVNMFIARLTGAETATVARKAATTWGDAVEDAAGSGRQAVEELKRTILGFDELNVLQDTKDKDGGGGSGGGSGTDVSSMFEQVPIESSISEFADRLKAAFEEGAWSEVGTIIGGKFNDIVNSVPWAEIGTNIGTGITAALQIVYGALTEADFQNLGSKFAELFNAALTAFDAETLGRLMVKKFSIIADLIVGAIMTVDWGLVTGKASEVIVGIFSEMSTWIQNVPWIDLTEALFFGLFDAITGIEYGKLIGSMVELFASALGQLAAIGVGILKTIWDGLVNAVVGIGTWIQNDIITPLIDGVDLASRNNGEAFLQLGVNLITLIFNGIKNFFGGIITWIGTNIVIPFIEGFTKAFFGAEKGAELLELGANIITGIFNGIINFFVGIGTWIKTNIFDKFVSGFKSIFGIHSPADNSTIVSLGANLIEGIFNGIVNFFANIGTWIRENIFDKFTAGWNTVFGDGGIIDTVVSVGVGLVKSGWETVTGWFSGLGEATTKVGDALQKGFALVKSGWSTVTGWFSGLGETATKVGGALEKGFSIVKSGWSTVTGWFSGLGSNYNSVGDALEKGYSIVKSGWSSVTGWFSGLSDSTTKVGDALEKGYSIVKSGWETVTGWFGGLPVNDKSVGGLLEKGYSIIKSGWETITGWFSGLGENTTKVGGVLEKGYSIVKSGWETVSGWFTALPVNTRSLGGVLEKGYSIVKSGWDTVSGWFSALPANTKSVGGLLQKGMEIVKSGWETVSGWFGSLPTNTKSVGGLLQKGMEVVKSGWTTVSGWFSGLPASDRSAGSALQKGLSMVRSGWTTVTSWFSALGAKTITTGSALEKGLGLTKSGWSKVTDWFLGLPAKEISVGSALKKGVSLAKSGWTTVQKWFNALPAKTTAASVKIKTTLTNIYSSIQDWFNDVFGNGNTPVVKTKVSTVSSTGNYNSSSSTSGNDRVNRALGGAFYRNKWHSIPQYASGGIPDHGTMFVAGEAGAEAVAHINGRTEVLNASQLASAIHAAVLSAMQQANAGGSAPLYVTVRTEDNEVLARAVAKGQRSLDARMNPTAAY